VNETDCNLFSCFLGQTDYSLVLKEYKPIHHLPTAKMTTATPVIIEKLPIRLGQFLKIANLVQDGFEAKVHIQYGEVLLNGVVETQRGKQLQKDDIVTFSGQDYLVTSP